MLNNSTKNITFLRKLHGKLVKKSCGGERKESKIIYLVFLDNNPGI